MYYQNFNVIRKSIKMLLTIKLCKMFLTPNTKVRLNNFLNLKKWRLWALTPGGGGGGGQSGGVPPPA